MIVGTQQSDLSTQLANDILSMAGRQLTGLPHLLLRSPRSYKVLNLLLTLCRLANALLGSVQLVVIVPAIPKARSLLPISRPAKRKMRMRLSAAMTTQH